MLQHSTSMSLNICMLNICMLNICSHSAAAVTHSPTRTFPTLSCRHPRDKAQCCL